VLAVIKKGIKKANATHLLDGGNGHNPYGELKVKFECAAKVRDVHIMAYWGRLNNIG
jgi:hypothetical protein